MNRRGFLKALGCLAAKPVIVKIVPSILVAPPVNEYTKYINFADVSCGVSIDPLLFTLQKELNYRLALSLDTLCKLTSDSIHDSSISFQPVLEMKHYAVLHSSDPVSLAA